MRHATKRLHLLGKALCCALVSEAFAAQEAWFAFPAQATFETGDTWIANGQRFRLYGVQSCLRGTFFTNPQGQKVDCGEAGIAMLAAMVKDLKPICSVTARSAQMAYVVCVADLTLQGRSVRLDLATSLITAGYSFAALTPDAKPVHEPYFVAQYAAQHEKRGFHAFPDTPDPNAILLRSLRQPPLNAGSPAPPEAPAPAPGRPPR
jgi:endonuclease YncB( thermonuclease family)